MGYILNDIMLFLRDFSVDHWVINSIIQIVIIVVFVIVFKKSIYYVFEKCTHGVLGSALLVLEGCIATISFLLLCSSLWSCNDDIGDSYIRYKRSQPVYSSKVIQRNYEGTRAEINIDLYKRDVKHNVTFTVTNDTLTMDDINNITYSINSSIKNMNDQINK